MNKKLLCAALLSGLAVAQTASAQDFDDRWYLTTSAGFNIQDGARGTRNAPFGTIGIAICGATPEMKGKLEAIQKDILEGKIKVLEG